MTLRQIHLVVYRSENGRDGWRPVGSAELPDWVKSPDVMTRLANGEECMDCAEGVVGSAWYRAVHVHDMQSLAPQ